MQCVNGGTKGEENVRWLGKDADPVRGRSDRCGCGDPFWRQVPAFWQPAGRYPRGRQTRQFLFSLGELHCDQHRVKLAGASVPVISAEGCCFC